MTQSNIFVCSENYVALWHISATKVPRDQHPKVKTNQEKETECYLYENSLPVRLIIKL